MRQKRLFVGDTEVLLTEMNGATRLTFPTLGGFVSPTQRRVFAVLSSLEAGTLQNDVPDSFGLTLVAVPNKDIDWVIENLTQAFDRTNLTVSVPEGV